MLWKVPLVLTMGMCATVQANHKPMQTHRAEGLQHACACTHRIAGRASLRMPELPARDGRWGCNQCSWSTCTACIAAPVVLILTHGTDKGDIGSGGARHLALDAQVGPHPSRSFWPCGVVLLSQLQPDATHQLNGVRPQQLIWQTMVCSAARLCCLLQKLPCLYCLHSLDTSHAPGWARAPSSPGPPARDATGQICCLPAGAEQEPSCSLQAVQQAWPCPCAHVLACAVHAAAEGGWLPAALPGAERAAVEPRWEGVEG